ncbi:MAG: glutathione S-transferase family protein [Wenzhouxiangellaceae bacterium]|nr:glutathione S-transferase family protein [Wenzhouxiangellaceae bacterium]
MSPAASDYVMYGAEFSLYSAKLRSYLRKKGIPFTEKSPSVLTYKRFIVPRTGVKFIPVLQTPEDEVLQDTTAIIDALEPRFPERGVYPATPRQHLASLLLELYGDEWLLLPAMHYRWNFPDDNLPYIYDEFGAMAFPWFPKWIRRRLGKKIGARFRGFVPRLGITEKTRPAIEKSWLGLLGELDAHFAEHDYLFGSRPSIGDFGLIGPMYAHLYRDPYPGRLMRAKAPRVAAWVERMQSTEPADGKFLSNDAIAPTLRPVLERMAREQLPVLLDTERRLAAWHLENPEQREIPRILGEHEFTIEGQTEKRMVLPYGLWRWQRPRDYLAALSASAAEPARELARELGLLVALKARPKVRIDRENNRFVIRT